MDLTNKQEAFVQALIAGKSQREAYRTAYNATKMKDATVDVKASELMKDGKVTVRYAELQASVRVEAEKKAVASAIDVLEELTGVGMGSKEFPTYDMFGKEYQRKPSVNERIKALELLGKHHKLFTDQVKLSGEMGVQIVDDIHG